ncbi:hypothetical protein BD324DRAFT_47206 [Kockovaella imperatae]|uniref:Uncharacterized protein n=1 Tax=Kockovaella imperatae TaxID=4999 RepID=A0A1Y1UT44_9TREE|nr:hypothetical protein BD324DRAFT_47206 [Kockovaella imperatae]ORX41181.1 hypothetical protein BD324DRAFT_47206 [Kockovaella imperatae]
MQAANIVETPEELKNQATRSQYQQSCRWFHHSPRQTRPLRGMLTTRWATVDTPPRAPTGQGEKSISANSSYRKREQRSRCQPREHVPAWYCTGIVPAAFSAEVSPSSNRGGFGSDDVAVSYWALSYAIHVACNDSRSAAWLEFRIQIQTAHRPKVMIGTCGCQQ